MCITSIIACSEEASDIDCRLSLDKGNWKETFGLLDRLHYRPRVKYLSDFGCKECLGG